ncbi:MAG: hypothetical protein ACFB0C_07290 [Leptolyngbyaceae cyanobacterium]
MLITPDFVYLHFAKTGGSFVANHLNKAYPSNSGKVARMLARALGHTTGVINTADYLSWNVPHHAPAGKIPLAFKKKLIVSNIRNPFDRYVSRYYYGGWKIESDHAHRLWPSGFPANWPELSFPEFIESLTDVSTVEGAQSRELKYFFGDAINTVKFLKFESLSQDLYKLLMRFNIDRPEILKNERKLPPTRKETTKIRSTKDKWQSYYDQTLIERVVAAEAYYFKLFPEYLP